MMPNFQGNSAKEQLENIQRACTSGIELVQMGVAHISDKKFLKLAQEAREITAHFQTRLIIEDRYKIAKEIKADGVCIQNPDSYSTLRKHIYTWQMISGKTTNLTEAENLIEKEVDYIILGPFKTKTQEFQNLGLNGFTAIVDALSTETPLIGVGGVTLKDVQGILETGISGIAVAEGITQDFNSIRTFHQLLNASVTQEQRHHFGSQ